jgi:hypothetical protein
VVERVAARLEDERLVLVPVPRFAGADVSLEIWGAERKADLLARVLGRPVVFQPGA